MKIQILGGGCKNCKKLLKYAETAAAASTVDTEIEYVTEMSAIAATGLMNTPGLIIDGKIRAAGRVPSVKEIKEMISDSVKTEQ